MRKSGILLMMVMLTLFWQADAARADEALAAIRIEKVKARPIFTGLRDNKNPVSALTEFFAPESNAPFISVAGAYQDLFTGPHVYVVETRQGALSLCGKPDDAQTCVPCPDCAAARESLLALDVSQTQGRYKEHRATFTYSAKAGRAETGFEFHKPATHGGYTPHITGRPTEKTYAQAGDYFSGKAYVFKAEAEKDYHLCPQARYDSAVCLICTDCAGKETLFDKTDNRTTTH